MPTFSPLAYYNAQFSLGIITLSTVSFCLETEITCEPFSIQSHSFVTAENCEYWESTWSACEIFAVACFTIEFVLRFVSCPSKLRFVQGTMNWVDLVAILPFYLELAFSAAGGDSNAAEAGSGAEESGGQLGVFSVFRVVRLVRVFRVFKMGKSSSGMKMMGSTLIDSAKVLFVLVFMVGIAVIVFSSAVFSFEQVSRRAPGWDRHLCALQDVCQRAAGALVQPCTTARVPVEAGTRPQQRPAARGTLHTKHVMLGVEEACAQCRVRPGMLLARPASSSPSLAAALLSRPFVGGDRFGACSQGPMRRISSRSREPSGGHS